MSKAIAQTVGGKRFAWLLALLAVFAVLASSQLGANSASAAGTGDGTLSAPNDQQGDVTLAPGEDTDPNYLYPGLYHVGPTGELLAEFDGDVNGNDAYVASVRDIENNLIGWEHIICLVPQDDAVLTALDLDGDINVEIGDDLQPDGGDGGIVGIVESPDDYNWYIQNLIGTANIVSAQKIDIDFDDYENGDDLPCVRWFSSGPGEQNVTVVSSTGTTAADMADGGSPEFANTADVCPDDNPENDECDNQDLSAPPGGPTFDGLTGPAVPLVKEWNLLDRTTIERVGSDVNLDGTTITVPAIFNPATSRYKALQTVALEELVYGTHITQGGATISPVVTGALVTFTASGSCGFTLVDGTFPLGSIIPVTTGTTLEGSPAGGNAAGMIIYPGDSITVTSIGVPIHFEVGTENCVTLGNMNHTVTISVDYPTNIGSQNPPIPEDETITINWVSSIANKHVLLAWAGQRVLLEHDWRIPPGGIDVDGFPGDNELEGIDTDIARCPWTLAGIPVVFVSKFLKQEGPGTFLSNNELGPLTAIGDLLLDLISPNEVNNITTATSCVSRAVYESNPPGQVDITLQVTDVCLDIDIDGGLNQSAGQSSIPAAFDCVLEPVDPLNQSKVDFVIYFMKFEDVRLSLVTSVSKPTHNSSAANWSDYSPGNPWDASTDVTTTEWNVSRDLLVRGRVRGWFENENDSGRARDDSDPLNVRPADRWVLPDDWAILAGGPADPADGSDAKGTAEEFRPYYDLMIAPNNTSGLALASPTGSGGFPQVATVVANPAGANTATTFAVSSAANLAVGSLIAVPSVGTSGGVGTCVTPGSSSVSAITPILNGVGNTVGVSITVSPALCATPAAGAGIFLYTGPFEGPLSLIDLPGFNTGAAPSNFTPGAIRDTTFADGDVDMWDAPMPQAPVSVKIRGAGFIKEVLKYDVYYLGTANSTAQTFPNPYYIVNVPAEPWISAISAGGGFLWDSWGLDGPGGTQGQGVYWFWQFARTGTNIVGVGDSTLTNTDRAELTAIGAHYGDDSITRDAVVFSDNHGEFMVTANGDFKLDYSGCATNAIAGGKHCKPGDQVGSSSISATVDYPEFRGKHPPVASNTVTVDWTWGGYKDVTIEDGETPQFKYIVFHALDRDGFCSFAFAQGTRSLHPVLSSEDEKATIGLHDPVETVDFLIDAGEGILVGQSSGSLNVDGNRQFATGVRTFSTAVNTTLKEFPFSPLAAAEATDECQAWVKVSNSLLGIVNFLVVAHDDEGDIGFDRVVDLQTTATYTLNFRWSLITWNGADNIPVADALGGTGANDAGNDISGEVTAVYGWEQSSQDWLGYFPAGVSVPGANDLTNLQQGSAYWIAIKAPGPVTWTYATNVD